MAILKKAISATKRFWSKKYPNQIIDPRPKCLAKDQYFAEDILPGEFFIIGSSLYLKIPDSVERENRTSFSGTIEIWRTEKKNRAIRISDKTSVCGKIFCFEEKIEIVPVRAKIKIF